MITSIFIYGLPVFIFSFVLYTIAYRRGYNDASNHYLKMTDELYSKFINGDRSYVKQ